MSLKKLLKQKKTQDNDYLGTEDQNLDGYSRKKLDEDNQYNKLIG